MDDVREKTKKENPDAKVSELSKIMGEAWNQIKETKEAEKYKKQATADKERYDKAMAAYKKE